jgi:hypothetical protein
MLLLGIYNGHSLALHPKLKKTLTNKATERRSYVKGVIITRRHHRPGNPIIIIVRVKRSSR